MTRTLKRLWCALGLLSTGIPASLPTDDTIRSAVIFSSAWCPACAAAKEYLVANDVDFTEIDLDRQSPWGAFILYGMEKCIGVKHQNVIPVIYAHGGILFGFNETKLQRLLARPRFKKDCL